MANRCGRIELHRRLSRLRTERSEVFIGIDSRVVSVFPFELQCIKSHRLNALDRQGVTREKRDVSRALCRGFGLAVGAGALLPKRNDFILAIAQIIPCDCELFFFCQSDFYRLHGVSQSVFQDSVVIKNVNETKFGKGNRRVALPFKRAESILYTELSE